MHSRFVGEKCFPIEKQERIKALVAICHADKLSTLDNQVKVIFAFPLASCAMPRSMNALDDAAGRRRVVELAHVAASDWTSSSTTA